MECREQYYPKTLRDHIDTQILMSLLYCFERADNRLFTTAALIALGFRTLNVSLRTINNKPTWKSQDCLHLHWFAYGAG